MIRFAHCRPARLKVLLAEVHVRLCAAKRGSREAKGMCRRDGARTKSWWISSAITRMPWRRQISPIVRRSSSDQTLPVGLCGLERMNSRVSSRMACSKIAASKR
ncbi:hypothetical protein AC251_09860 [Ralstonia pseudosolanacearum]|nr:hypothetical protein AC251_09860 [Ralstonia pseudosolanacearum]ASL74972.1 hypothetical protein BC350_16170 [Ralstonia pseudosolanacearum]